MTDWTESEDAMAKKLWLEGKSASEVAAALNRSFPGTKRSRNSIIGRIHRQGLSDTRMKAAAPATYRPPRAPAVSRCHLRGPKPGPQNRPADVFGKIAVDSPEVAEAKRTLAALRHGDAAVFVDEGAGVSSPNARPFMEAERGCCWPLSGNRVCCNPITRNRYCEGHASIAYVPVPPKMARETGRLMSRFGGRVALVRTPKSAERSLWDDAREAA